LVVLVVGRAGEDGGVKVERPQPKARTYDLDASVGRRTLVDDDNVVLLTGSRPVFASGPSRGWRWLRCGRFGCQGISSFRRLGS
jgi:hypothetical protein